MPLRRSDVLRRKSLAPVARAAASATPGVGAAGLGRITGRGGTGREGAALGRAAPGVVIEPGVVIADGGAAAIGAGLGAVRRERLPRSR